MGSSESLDTLVRIIAEGGLEKAAHFCLTHPCGEDVDCQRFLGWAFYKSGQLEGALRWFELAIEKGDAESAFGKGSVYYLKNEYKLALNGFMIAADRGYSRSYYWMAGIYLEGLGVDKDIKKAELYYQKSAECGYLAGKGGLARVQATKGGLSRLVLLPRLIVLAVAAFFIAYKNKDDSRIVDVTNYFEAKGAK